MGAHGSHHAPKREDFPNLNVEQLTALQAIVRQHTDDYIIDEKTMKALFPVWGDYAKVAFENLHKLESCEKGKLPLGVLVQQANLLEGISSEQAEALTNLWGNQWCEALVHSSRVALELSAQDEQALMSILKHEKSSNLANLITANRLASDLVHFPFRHLLGESKSAHATLIGNTRLMNNAHRAVLRSYLPIEFRKEWKLLFSSNEHGSSFAQLTQRVDKHGPVFVIVRSTKGRVFGCYASHGFVVGPQYRGDTRCFLFTLSPELRVYEPTGFTDKYCYLNIGQETLSNGLGIGGSGSVWPFFLKEEYGKGLACAHSSNFEKCDLAGEQDFDVDTIEVWRVGPEPAHLVKSKSVLDKDPQAAALLELSGKAMHSEAFREPAPLLAEEEEEHDTKF